MFLAAIEIVAPVAASQTVAPARDRSRRYSCIPGWPTRSVKERILALAVEKTGYPEDMLDLDLDLEADLGVDTVKQAEMFAAIREIYNIPRDENRKLRDYPTLAHVIRFVFEKRPDLAGVSLPKQAPSQPRQLCGQLNLKQSHRSRMPRRRHLDRLPEPQASR